VSTHVTQCQQMSHSVNTCHTVLMGVTKCQNMPYSVNTCHKIFNDYYVNTCYTVSTHLYNVIIY